MSRRLTVDMSDENGLRFDRLIDHGYKGQLVNCILCELLDILESIKPDKRALLIGAILSKDISVLEAVKMRWKKDEPI